MILQVNGLALNVWVEGDATAPAVLLLHGWPDSCQLWKNQVPVLAQAGFRAIAPDLRGYGDSDKPTGVKEYAFKNVLQDIIGILQQLKVDRFYLVGHDWGRPLHDEEQSGRLCTGNLSKFHSSIAANGYMLVFMRPEAEKALSAGNWAALRHFLRGCKPEQLEDYIQRLSEPGALTASLNWYRANMRVEFFMTRERPQLPLLEIPVMGIWGAKDGACLEPQMKNSERFLKPGLWRYERVEGSGHWLPIDAPERVNQLLLNFFGAPLAGAAKL